MRSKSNRVLMPSAAQTFAENLNVNQGHKILARGLGRSYGDSALNSGGTVIDCRGLDHLLALDPAEGTLHCEAGISIAELNRVLVPAGWMLPVTPGTQYVTVGGAIANDVHGKNHLQCGTFGNHVREIQLLRSSGKILTCSDTQNRELFSASIGGLGLTGVMLSAKLGLRPIRSVSMQVGIRTFSELDMLFDSVANLSAAQEYRSVWFDPAGGCRSGLCMTASHLQDSAGLEWRARPLSLPVGLQNLPTGMAGRLLFKAGNFWYRRGIRRGQRTDHMAAVLYPLDRYPNWNTLYGKNGFYQHQCLFPGAAAREALAALFNVPAIAGQKPALAVGKWFGQSQSPGMLSFPAPGFSVALDFANLGARTLHLLEKLDRVVTEYGGRIYPAKDASMSADMFTGGYPGLERFATHVDSGCSSDFWRRMGRAA